MKKIKTKNVIEIKEDVRIPGTDVILEAGDQVEILKEDTVKDIVRALAPIIKRMSWDSESDGEIMGDALNEAVYDFLVEGNEEAEENWELGESPFFEGLRETTQF